MTVCTKTTCMLKSFYHGSSALVSAREQHTVSVAYLVIHSIQKRPRQFVPLGKKKEKVHRFRERHSRGEELSGLKNAHLKKNKDKKKTLARQHHHHSSSASGMRQWKIPGAQCATVKGENRGRRGMPPTPMTTLKWITKTFFLKFFFVFLGCTYIYITQKDNPQEIQIYNQDMVSRSFSAAKKQQKHLAARAKG